MCCSGGRGGRQAHVPILLRTTKNIRSRTFSLTILSFSLFLLLKQIFFFLLITHFYRTPFPSKNLSIYFLFSRSLPPSPSSIFSKSNFWLYIFVFLFFFYSKDSRRLPAPNFEIRIMIFAIERVKKKTCIGYYNSGRYLCFHTPMHQQG